MYKSVCIPSEYRNIVEYTLTKYGITYAVESGKSDVSAQIPMSKRIRQYNEIAMAAPEEDEQESILQYPAPAKKQIIENMAYNLTDFDQTEQFIIDFCKKIINSQIANEEFMKKRISEQSLNLT